MVPPARSAVAEVMAEVLAAAGAIWAAATTAADSAAEDLAVEMAGAASIAAVDPAQVRHAAADSDRPHQRLARLRRQLIEYRVV